MDRVAVPALVKGRLVSPGDGPVWTDQRFVYPAVDPADLVETDPAELARSLYALPFREVLAYAAGLRDLVGPGNPVLRDLLDPDGIGALVDRELGTGDGPGRRYLDGWFPVPGRPTRTVRAVPTRQLHVTAGNVPVVPLVSVVWALATKGAAVVKSPAGATTGLALLARAMHRLDPDHPITRHTSLLYWPGGDRAVEDLLLAPGAFDRLVVWGSAQAVGSLAGRAAGTRQVLLAPRVGMSLIGREAFGGDLAEVAARAAADTMVADQAACTSSLVHYVEGTRALEYCEALRAELARWDEKMPRTPSPQQAAQLRRLRRGQLVAGTWFCNGQWPEVTSAVVCMPTPFDLSAHPMSRCVVVRPVADLAEAMPFFHPGVSTVGVYPDSRREALRDELVARGVSTVLPLGGTAQVYPGMPHDGMRVTSELVNWVNG